MRLRLRWAVGGGGGGGGGGGCVPCRCGEFVREVSATGVSECEKESRTSIVYIRMAFIG